MNKQLEPGHIVPMEGIRPFASYPPSKAAQGTHFFALREAVRSALAAPHYYKWTIHGLGMARCYPFGGDRLRLNVWDSRFKTVPPASALHTHPWGLYSWIIAGQIVNHRYIEVEPDMPGTNFESLEVGCGDQSGKVCAPLAASSVRLGACQPEVYRPGQAYAQHADEIHATGFSESAVTLMERQFVPGRPMTARVFYEGTLGWIDAAPRTARRDEVQALCDRALYAFDLP